MEPLPRCPLPTRYLGGAGGARVGVTSTQLFALLALPLRDYLGAGGGMLADTLLGRAGGGRVGVACTKLLALLALLVKNYLLY